MKFSPSVTLLSFVTYIVFTGSVKPYDLFTGALIATILGFVAGRYIVKSEVKAFSPIRWFWALIYFVKYMTVIEARAHWSVVKLLFTGRYEAGIVKVPLGVRSGYAKILVANSITNTPGTVVVDISDKYLYVNWINVATEKPEEAKKYISEEFERYAARIFE